VASPPWTVNRKIKKDHALLYGPSMWRLTILKGRIWFREILAKAGDNTKIMLAGDYGLKHDTRVARSGDKMTMTIDY
jgi:hypothetical protein